MALNISVDAPNRQSQSGDWSRKCYSSISPDGVVCDGAIGAADAAAGPGRPGHQLHICIPITLGAGGGAVGVAGGSLGDISLGGPAAGTLSPNAASAGHPPADAGGSAGVSWLRGQGVVPRVGRSRTLSDLSGAKAIIASTSGS